MHGLVPVVFVVALLIADEVCKSRPRILRKKKNKKKKNTTTTKKVSEIKSIRVLSAPRCSLASSEAFGSTRGPDSFTWGGALLISLGAGRMPAGTLHGVGEKIVRTSLHYIAKIFHLLKGCVLLMFLADDLKNARVWNDCHYYCNNIASRSMLLLMLSAPVIFKTLLKCQWSTLVLGNKEAGLSLFYR